MPKKRIYKIRFLNEGKVYELYARQVSQGALYGFVEVADIIFGERSQVIVDPTEQELKSEFAGVKRTYIPMHALVRIDEVEKEGAARIVPVPAGGDKVVAFPAPIYTPGGPAKG